MPCGLVAGCALIVGLEDGELAPVASGGAGGTSAGTGGSAGTITSGGNGGAGGSGAAGGGSGGGTGGMAGGGTGGAAGGGTGGTSTGGGGGATDPYAQAVLADNPIAYFRLDDPIGSGALTNEIPASPITAVYPPSGATLEVAGIKGSKAIHFDQTGAKISVYGGMDFPNDQEFTIELWVKLDTAGSQGIYHQTVNNGGLHGSNMFITNVSLLRTEVWNSGTIIMYNLTSTSPPVGSYFHIALRHRAGEADELYVNGSQSPGQQLAAGQRPSMTKTFEWGGFVGSMDEFAVYNVPLTGGQIAAHYAAGL